MSTGEPSVVPQQQAAAAAAQLQHRPQPAVRSELTYEGVPHPSPLPLQQRLQTVPASPTEGVQLGQQATEPFDPYAPSLDQVQRQRF
jgi:hypothetical protein